MLRGYAVSGRMDWRNERGRPFREKATAVGAADRAAACGVLEKSRLSQEPRGRSLRAAEVRHSPQASCADTPPGCGRKRLLRRRTLPGSASASCAGKSQAPLTPSVGSAAPVSAGRIPRISSCGRRARGGATACRRRCRRPPPRERRSECSGSWPWSPP